jgi:hypothetical protein
MTCIHIDVGVIVVHEHRWQELEEKDIKETVPAPLHRIIYSKILFLAFRCPD